MLLSTRPGLFKTTYLASKDISTCFPSILFPRTFIYPTPNNTNPTENSENLTQEREIKRLRIRYLISSTATGQSRNMLFEECDRHLKERLFRAAKIESFLACSIHYKQKAILTHKN
jgi:hypothetical protein